MKYCSKCGSEIHDDAVICVKCGCSTENKTVVEIVNSADVSPKNGVATLLLCFFLGYIGVHRFYTGHVGTGIIQIVTLGGCGVWTLIDFIMIICGSFKDSDGKIVKI